VESYIACQFICGPESDRPGEGSYSWATGTAAWTLVVVWEWMPGVRPEFGEGGSIPILLVVKRFVHKAVLYFGLEETVDIIPGVDHC
jgi:hypothetical protein